MICSRYRDKEGKLFVVTLDPALPTAMVDLNREAVEAHINWQTAKCATTGIVTGLGGELTPDHLVATAPRADYTQSAQSR